jgi:hypothetical protein
MRGGIVAMASMAVLACASAAAAQNAPSAAPVVPCRFICEVEWKVEPTWTIENLAGRHRVVTADGATEHARRERVFETVLALDLGTKLQWLGFTAEAITSPFSDENDVELELESNFNWLTEKMTRGWLSSHFDVVDQFSPAERPQHRRAYTHKLDFELDTAFHPFQMLPEGKWLRGLELETSLDYLATGLPAKGDVFPDGTRYLDDASHWSLSFVVIIPVAPF